jgi:hypothetical protein
MVGRMIAVANLDLVLLMALVVVVSLLPGWARTVLRWWRASRNRIAQDRDRWGRELEGRRYVGSRKDW